MTLRAIGDARQYDAVQARTHDLCPTTMTVPKQSSQMTRSDCNDKSLDMGNK